MTDTLALSVATRQARANQWPTRLAGGTLTIYDGTAPVTPDTAVTTQTALAAFSLPSPAGTATAGTFTGADVEAALSAAEGTAAWARTLDSNGDPVADWTVGLVGSGEAIEIDNLSIVSGSYITLAAWGVYE